MLVEELDRVVIAAGPKTDRDRSRRTIDIAKPRITTVILRPACSGEPECGHGMGTSWMNSCKPGPTPNAVALDPVKRPSVRRDQSLQPALGCHPRQRHRRHPQSPRDGNSFYKRELRDCLETAMETANDASALPRDSPSAPQTAAAVSGRIARSHPLAIDEGSTRWGGTIRRQPARGDCVGVSR